MEFKEGSYYLVKHNNINNRVWCFIYYSTDKIDIDLTYIVHGYSNIDKTYLFFDRFYDNRNDGFRNYSFHEICIEKAMEYFPDNDVLKINYLRKKRIKNLLSIKKD